MNKTIKVNNKEYEVSVAPSFALLYEEKFGKDILTFLNSFADALGLYFSEMFNQDSYTTVRDYLDILSEPGLIGFYEIIWASLKDANDSVKDFRDWLKEDTEDIQALDFMVSLLPVIYESLASKKKPMELLSEMVKKFTVEQKTK